MSDIESLQNLSGQLKHGAQQFSDASQKLSLQARGLDWSAQDLANGANAWAGAGSQNFTTAWNTYHQSTQKSVTALNNTSQALTRLAQKIDETVQQLQDQQAQQSSLAIGMGVLTVGLVVLDVLQLGLDPVTDGLTVAAGSADAAAISGTEAAAGSAEVAAQGLVEADAQIAGDLDEIVNGIDNVADSGDIAADGGTTPGDINVDDGPFNDSGTGSGGNDTNGSSPSDSTGGQPRGGHTSGDDPNRYGNPERGFGNLDNQTFDITEDNVNKIEQHLSKPDFLEPDGSIAPENARMIERLRTAIAEGKPISGADASFYFHELYESDLMDNGGLDYATAHRMALDYYNVSDFTVYHPDVIQEFSENFGRLWLKFWGIGG